MSYCHKFTDLVCRSLRFNKNERPTINELLKHKFFYIQDEYGIEEYQVGIKELLSISFPWSK